MSKDLRLQIYLLREDLKTLENQLAAISVGMTEVDAKSHKQLLRKVLKSAGVLQREIIDVLPRSKKRLGKRGY